MGIKSLFNKKSKTPRGFLELEIAAITKLTSDSVQVTLAVPSELKSTFDFIPGQYIDFSITLMGEEFRRSYSICSGPDEPLSVAVKKVQGGTISLWFNEKATVGTKILCMPPQGQFILANEEKNCVAFAAGSGITPIISIAKSLSNGAKMHLFYGNKTMDSTLFGSEITKLPNVTTHLFFSQENKEGNTSGRMDEAAVSELIKSNLDLLKADVYLLCGPNEMIETVTKKLELFGVSKEKIKREFFTPPVEPTHEAEGPEPVRSKVTVILDGEEITLNYKPKGKSIIELLDAEGYDPPYSCRGGVCSTCRATLTSGTAKMRMNYVLTDQEIAEGSILCCQAEPTSDKVTITFNV